MKKELLAAALLLAGASAVRAEDVTVPIRNFMFGMNVTVSPGSKVTWTNRDGEPHTVASLDGLFRSPALDEGDSYSFTFDKPGVYRYLCSIHPGMRGAVTVK